MAPISSTWAVSRRGRATPRSTSRPSATASCRSSVRCARRYLPSRSRSIRPRRQSPKRRSTRGPGSSTTCGVWDQPTYANVTREIVEDLERALDRAVGLGVPFDRLIVDPGIGFGKTAQQNLTVLRELAALRVLGRPILLGTSRKSTIGKVLDLPADQRLEGTLATTALGVAAGVDIVRVHDVQANVRAARMADAIVRGGWEEAEQR